MEKLIIDNTKLMIDNGKIVIPKDTKHIKLDIGLSYSAPHSQLWLKKEKDLIVFGFEPHPDCVKSINEGAIKRHESHGETLEIKYINKNFYLIPCALGLKNENVKFYSTINDVGCSSVFEPHNMNDIAKIINVPCFTLKTFFDLFPFEEFNLIEYIKVDAQGSDLDIIKSGGEYIKNNVAVITLEAENAGYKNTNNSEADIFNYMESIGFKYVKSNLTLDPTFINTKFEHLNIYYEQCG
jgi:FkbM family methyltransferase